MSSEQLNLQPNAPAQIALQFPAGLVVQGQWGPRVLFTLVDGRRFYAPPVVQDLITKQGIQPRESFSICKREIKDGGGKATTRWEVKRLDPPASQPESSSPASQPAVTPSGTTTTQHPSANGKSKQQILNELGSVLVNAAAAPRTEQPPPYSHTGWAAFLREQATSLIDVAASCHRYAAEKYPGMLRAEDVSDLVTSVFINLAR